MPDSQSCDTIRITHLRDQLGEVCRRVAETKRPVVIQCHQRADVALVPLSAWEALKALEAKTLQLTHIDLGDLDV